MSNVIEKVKVLWNKEQIKVLVILSMMLQIVLIFFAPLRKHIRDKRLLLLLWLAYLGADYVATLTLGSILANTFDNSSAYLPGQSITSFWAPFLLLHLGGPDNITSYSIEDNELWLRHLLSFVVQVSTAFSVIVQSTLQTSSFLVPSILVFIVGMAKFGERTLALRAASWITPHLYKFQTNQSRLNSNNPQIDQFVSMNCPDKPKTSANQRKK
ncbi:hypothetical protein LUZ63_008476 [Rhynchospora breviuscula]|uniref:DUF4220 domain-containing protein n=1 Tax=Rhynchospora breviuscula TaxID=2022672 RepID=A0A9Q0CUV4_9POAL|nr:hypothetical protein LUZ63_008476 [Rhynchospora breviuscula]